MLYVGIDPGESWCGFAALDVVERTIRVEARTYSVTARNGWLHMAHDLLDLLPHNRPTHIIAEDFRIRHSGHQRFSHGDTLRFLGALEFGVKSIDAFQFFLVPASDHGERETRELFGRVLSNYRDRWPRANHRAWDHCLSAWRVIGLHLLQHDRETLMALRNTKRSRRCSRWLPVSLKSEQHEHVAPAARWPTQSRST